MGGGAFPTTARISSSQHTALSAHLLGVLAPFYSSVSCPPVDPGKTSHGDLDLLVVLKPGTDQLKLRDEVANLLSAEDRYVNGTLSSFLLPGHIQVDIVSVPASEFKISEWLRSYGVVGHILIKCLQPFKLILTYSGLYIQPAHIGIGKFFLCDDIDMIWKFLGLKSLCPNPSREDLYLFIESASIDGTPVVNAWKLPQQKTGFSVREQVIEFHARRESDPPQNHEIEFDAIQYSIEHFDKQSEYSAFIEDFERLRRKTEYNAELKKRVAAELTPETTQAERQRITLRIKAELLSGSKKHVSEDRSRDRET